MEGSSAYKQYRDTRKLGAVDSGYEILSSATSLQPTHLAGCSLFQSTDWVDGVKDFSVALKQRTKRYFHLSKDGGLVLQ